MVLTQRRGDSKAVSLWLGRKVETWEGVGGADKVKVAVSVKRFSRTRWRVGRAGARRSQKGQMLGARFIFPPVDQRQPLDSGELPGVVTD